MHREIGIKPKITKSNVQLMQQKLKTKLKRLMLFRMSDHLKIISLIKMQYVL